MSEPYDLSRDERDILLAALRLSRLAPIIALCAAGLLTAGCSKADRGTTTTTTATSVTTAGRARAAPTGAISLAAAAGGAMAVSRGAVDDTSQTAAVSPPANSNGTTPTSPGVGPPGGVTPASAAAIGAAPR